MKLVILILIFATKIFGECPPSLFPEPPSFCYEIQPEDIFCDGIDGYCGVLESGTFGPMNFPSCPLNSLDNPEWIAFVAGTTTIDLLIESSNCIGIQWETGVQAAIYDDCFNYFPMATQCGLNITAFVLEGNEFIPGETYYLVIDGWGESICEYDLSVIQGSTISPIPDPVTEIFGEMEVCPDNIFSYTIPPAFGASAYNWSMFPSDGFINPIGNGEEAMIQFYNPGAFTLCVDSENACENSNSSFCTTIIVEPIPVTTIVHEYCPGDWIECAGQIFYSPGVHTVTLNNYLGCDSIVNCILNLIFPVVIEQEIFVCNNELIAVCDTLIEADSEPFLFTCETYQGCDSIIIFVPTFIDYELQIDTIPNGGLGDDCAVLTMNFVNSSSNLSTNFYYGNSNVPFANGIGTICDDGLYCFEIIDNNNQVYCSECFYWGVVPDSIDLFKCDQECIEYENIDLCEFGDTLVTFQTPTGMDSTIFINVIEISESLCIDLPPPNTCDANGGLLDLQSLSIQCFGQTILSSSFQVNFNGNPPNPNPFDYRFLLIENGIVVQILDLPIENVYSNGNYELYGISYDNTQNQFLEDLLDLPIEVIQNQLGSLNTQFCADLSDDFLELMILSESIANIEATICEGDCFTFLGIDYCQTGTYQDTIFNGSYLGCDSLINLHLTVLPTIITEINEFGCEGDCVEYNGIEICNPSTQEFIFFTVDGCDSTVIFNWDILDVNFQIAPPDILDCDNPSIQLIAQNTSNTFPNSNISYEWSGPSIIGSNDGLTIEVTNVGVYCLTMIHEYNGFTCEEIQCIEVLGDLDIPNAPLIDGQTIACIGEALIFTASPSSGTIPTDYSWTTSDGIPFNIINQNTIEVLDIGISYEICVVAENDCGASVAACLFVSVEESSATLSGSGEICEGSGETVDLIVEFFGTSPFELYYSIDGVVQTPLFGLFNNPFILTVAYPGVYQIEQIIDGNGCFGIVDGSIAEVTTTNSISVQNLLYFDDTDNQTFVVSFEIAGGNQSSIVVEPMNGTLSGNNPTLFTSNPMICGSSFVFTVSDGSVCPSEVITDNEHFCECLTEAGNLEAMPIEVCGTEFTINHLGDEILEGNDVLNFGLYEQPQPFSTLLSLAGEPNFFFDSAIMTYGTSYYIAAIAGNNGGFGLVDLNDPCTDFSNFVEVVFHEEVTSEFITTNTIICEGETTALEIFLSGTAPWSFDLIGNGLFMESFTTNNSPFFVDVSPDISTSYEINNLQNNSPCNVQSLNMANIAIDAPSNISLSASSTSICLGETVQITASINPLGDIFWTPSVFLSCTNCPDPVAAPTVTTTYQIIVTSPNGCTSVEEITITVGDLSIESITSDTVVCFSENLELIVDAPNATAYQWSPTENLTCTDCPNPATFIIEDVTFYVTVSDDFGCELVDSIQVIQTCWLIYDEIESEETGYQDLFYPPYIPILEDECFDLEEHTIHGFYGLPDSLFYVGINPGTDSICIDFVHPQDPNNQQTLTIIVQVNDSEFQNFVGNGNENTVASAITKKELSIFPNPTSDNISIQSEEEILEVITIYDFNGKLVETNIPEASVVEMNLENLPAGIYIIQIKTVSKTWTERIVKME